jgi:hypothetical protein
MIETEFLEFIQDNSSTKNSPFMAEGFIDFLDSYHSIKDINFHKNYPLFNQCITQFLELFCSDTFIIPVNHIITFIELNNKISDLVSVSVLKNTDKYIIFLLNNANKINNQNSFSKILALLGSRNRIKVNYHELFSINHKLSSLWYWIYLSQISYINENDYKNLQNHLDHIELINNNSLLCREINNPFFYSTYASPDKDRSVKEKINSLLKNIFRATKITNFPEKNNSPKGAPVFGNTKNKIAVITGVLSPTHPVHRTLLPYIKSLIPDYELTLVHLGKMRNEIDTGIFSNIINFELTARGIDLSVLLNNNFSLVFYPDIGMTSESVFLSNLRIAPVQVTALGHSVSTFGSEIDYFISGIESEIIEKSSENYSERLVLIPGTGLHTTFTNLPNPKFLFDLGRWKNGLNQSKIEDFIIACPWGSQKINYRHLNTLKKILNNSEKKITYLFLPALEPDCFFLNLQAEVINILGRENVEIIGGVLTHNEYLEQLAKADLVIDSFHFGGYNSTIDSLFLKKPVVTLEGSKAYNRFSAALLRRLGLQELITTEIEGFIEKVSKLVNNDNYYDVVYKKIMAINPVHDLFKEQEVIYFRRAVDYLIEHHHRLQQDKLKDPVIIAH